MGLSYRTDEEVEQWRKRDPIESLEKRLADQGILSPEAAQAVHDEVRTQVQDSVRFAEQSPMPDPSTLLEDVYAA